MGRTEEGLSSNRPEYVAAWLALIDALKSDEPVIILTDSLGFLTSIQNWIGEGTDPILSKSPDGEILREIIELLESGCSVERPKPKNHLHMGRTHKPYKQNGESTNQPYGIQTSNSKPFQLHHCVSHGGS